MRGTIKTLIKKTHLYLALKNWQEKRRHRRQLREWENRGRSGPPPHLVKQSILKGYAEEYGLRIFVETGTLYGEMVHAMRGAFDRVYSIELSPELFSLARERFRSAANVELIQGDSANELAGVMANIDQPALFWLDGHYSGGVTARGEKDTPIFEELNTILAGGDRGHVIIIDDARCFGTDPAYPTIADLENFVRAKSGNVQLAVADDLIRIVPAR